MLNLPRILGPIACLMLCVPAGSVWAKAPVPARSDGPQWALPDAAGQVVIVNFWATWCAPCRQEMPALDAFFTAHRKDGLAMVAISMDDPSRAKQVREAALGFHFAVQMSGKLHIPSRYRPRQLPVTLVFDRNGVLRFDSRKTPNPALIDAAMLDRVVTPLLQTRY